MKISAKKIVTLAASGLVLMGTACKKNLPSEVDVLISKNAKVAEYDSALKALAEQKKALAFKIDLITQLKDSTINHIKIDYQSKNLRKIRTYKKK